MMKKHKTVLKLLEIFYYLKDQNVEIVDFWDADLCAIGLKRCNKLVYISTFYVSESGLYDYDLENLDVNNIPISIVEKRKIKLEDLIIDVENFLLS